MNVLKNYFRFGAALALTIVALGCTSLEKQAYRTVVGAKAFIDAEKRQHPECVSGLQSTACAYLVRATSAKDALIDALEVYCAGAQFDQGSGPCQPPTKGTPAYVQGEAKLKAAIATYEQAEKDLKGAL